MRLRRDASFGCDARFRACSGTHHITANKVSNITTPQGVTSLARKGKHHFTKQKDFVILGLKEGANMAESKLRMLSMDFAVEIVNLVRELRSKHENVIANQIGRSGTSIGANIHEANYAQGKKDFISKLEIALKEASETGYWLELLHRTSYIDDVQHKSLSEKCASIRVMLIASCRTAKENEK